MTNIPLLVYTLSPGEIQVGEPATITIEITSPHPVPITTISLQIPFGGSATDLSLNATGVVLKPDNAEWSVEDRGGGVFTIEPSTGNPETLKNPLLLQLSIPSISRQIGTCLVEINENAGGQQTTTSLSITKYPQKFHLDNFQARPSFINPGTPVALTWDFTPGLSPCPLTLLWLDQVGKQQTRDVSTTHVYTFPNQNGDPALEVDTVFQLKADFGDDVIVTREILVKVETPRILSFGNQGPDEIFVGDTASLFWVAEYFQSFEIKVNGEKISGRLPGDCSTFSHQPTKTTTYTLYGFVGESGMDEKQLDEKQLTLEVFDLQVLSESQQFVNENLQKNPFEDETMMYSVGDMAAFPGLWLRCFHIKNGSSWPTGEVKLADYFSAYEKYENILVAIKNDRNKPGNVYLLKRFGPNHSENSILICALYFIDVVGPGLWGDAPVVVKVDFYIKEMHILPDRSKFYIHAPATQACTIYSCDTQTNTIKPTVISFQIENFYVSLDSSFLYLLSRNPETRCDQVSILDTSSDQILVDRWSLQEDFGAIDCGNSFFVKWSRSAEGYQFSKGTQQFLK